MSVCQYCDKVAGLHSRRCPVSLRVKPSPARPAPAEPGAGTRIEITGNIVVHHPIRPTGHTTAKESAVMCA